VYVTCVAVCCSVLQLQKEHSSVAVCCSRGIISCVSITQKHLCCCKKRISVTVYCNTLLLIETPSTATHCMQHTATHRNTPQHTATLFNFLNALQHTATCCNATYTTYISTTTNPRFWKPEEASSSLCRDVVCCSVLQYVAVCGLVFAKTNRPGHTLQHTAAHCSTLQHVTSDTHDLFISIQLQILKRPAKTRPQDAVLCGAQCVAVCCSVLQCVAVCCSVLQCGAVCCSALQCVAVCCSVIGCCIVHHLLQCVAGRERESARESEYACVCVCVCVCACVCMCMYACVRVRVPFVAAQ